MKALQVRLRHVADHVQAGLQIDDDADLLRLAADELGRLHSAISVHRASHTGMPTANDKALWGNLEGTNQ